MPSSWEQFCKNVPGIRQYMHGMIWVNDDLGFQVGYSASDIIDASLSYIGYIIPDWQTFGLVLVRRYYDDMMARFKRKACDTDYIDACRGMRQTNLRQLCEATAAVAVYNTYHTSHTYVYHYLL